MKRVSDITGFAIFGNDPLFPEPLHVGRPNIGNREALHRRINDLLDRKWLSNDGPYVKELEARLSSYLGVKHCITMCNGTVALEIATRALGLSGEVIVPSFTFIATAHSLQWQEITPVFCDVDPASHTIDPRQVEKMITPKTTGIIGVHLWGRACAIDDLAGIAERKGLVLLFDAAHAFGCTHEGRMIGNFGAAEVFSFHATKFFNSFEGGAVATNDDNLAKKIRLMKNFGFAGYDDVIYIGTNGKMTEVAAAMALTNFESLDDIVEANRRNHTEYQRRLSQISGLRILEYDDSEKTNYQYVVVEIDERTCGLSRDMLLAVLRAENIIARRYFYPGCHRMEPYRSFFPHAGLLLPVTVQLSERVLLLPTGTSIATDEIMKICDVIRIAVEHAPQLRTKLEPAR